MRDLEKVTIPLCVPQETVDIKPIPHVFNREHK